MFERGTFVEPLQGQLFHRRGSEEPLAWRFLEIHVFFFVLLHFLIANLDTRLSGRCVKTWGSYCFFQIYQLSEEKGIKGGGGRELKS